METKNQDASNDDVLKSLQTPQLDSTGRVDMEQIRYRLSLTPAQRLDENDRAARFVAMLHETGRKARGRVE